MTIQRFLRLVPDRSQLLLLGAIAGVIFAAISFANLAVVRTQALERHAHVKAKRDLLLEQQERLRDQLEQNEAGQNIAPRAWEYFRLAPKGVLMLEPVPVPVVTAVPEAERSAGPPYWAEWYEHLTALQ